MGQRRVPGQIFEERNVDDAVVDAQLPGDPSGGLDLANMSRSVVDGHRRQFVACAPRERRDRCRIETPR